MAEADEELEQLAMKILEMEEEEFKEFLVLPKEDQMKIVAEALGQETEKDQDDEQFLIQCYQRLSEADRQILKRVAAALAGMSGEG